MTLLEAYAITKAMRENIYMIAFENVVQKFEARTWVGHEMLLRPLE